VDHPLDQLFQRLQPLVLVDDAIFVLGPDGAPAAIMRTASGLCYSLRRLCSLKTFLVHFGQATAAKRQQMFEAEWSRQKSAVTNDAFKWVVEHLVSALLTRDLGQAVRIDQPAASSRDGPIQETGFAADPAAMPTPPIPQPAVCLCGRLWLLRPAEEQDGCMQVETHTKTWGLTGDYWLLRSLNQQWLGQVHMTLREQVENQIRVWSRGDSPETQTARVELGRRGFWQHGQLLYLPGSPPRLGHVLPSHHNSVLGRHCEGDVAVAAKLTLPPTISSLEIYQRSGERWLPYSPPNGLCLGGLAPVPLMDPGLTLFAYLRAAAVRLATNGRFHANDGQESYNS
jgi:hypothetical protein